MELIFLGTASNNPTPDRNVSCTCLRYGNFNSLIYISIINVKNNSYLEGEIWLFDCGEATQIQSNIYFTENCF
jgi:ribonuclease BN (tRNA processing enzyme)